MGILTELLLLFTYQVSPREDHLHKLLRIVAFLKRKPTLTLYFDPTLPQLDKTIVVSTSNVEQFKDQYRGIVEEILAHIPSPRGRQVENITFVDISHVSNQVTRRFHTGFIIFIIRAPIIWHSKKKNTLESSTFSREFIAMTNCMEHVVAL